MKKHIVCFGDSNTHGHCSDPMDTADRGGRYNEDERWTCLLQKSLGEGYLVIEEGLAGRTTVFDDPLRECMSGLDVIYSTLLSHEPVSLLVIMLGTNDTKERFSANAACIGKGLERLALKAETVPAWKDGKPNILVISPPCIGEGHNEPDMGKCCHATSLGIAAEYKVKCELHGWAFFDAEGVAEFNRIDYMHLTAKGHRQLAAKLSEIIPELC